MIRAQDQAGGQVVEAALFPVDVAGCAPFRRRTEILGLPVADLTGHPCVVGLKSPAGGAGVFEIGLGSLVVAEPAIPFAMAGVTGLNMVQPGPVGFFSLGVVAAAAAVTTVAVDALEIEHLHVIGMVE